MEVKGVGSSCKVEVCVELDFGLRMGRVARRDLGPFIAKIDVLSVYRAYRRTLWIDCTGYEFTGREAPLTLPKKSVNKCGRSRH